MASASPAQQIVNPSKPFPQRHLWREWRFWLFLALVLAPCFWQRRIQAGDLSSHLYNSWLALQIRSGAIHGLSIVPQWTNVAFDWLVTWLLATFGAGPAQRISVSLAVLAFAGGAFTFITAASDRRPWFLTPCIAMLAYGFVFHIGFFNFYLSLGICLWFLAAIWNGKPSCRMAATLLLGLAWLAHPLPVVWALGAAVYLIIGQHICDRRRFNLLAVGLAALLAMREFLSIRYHTAWSAFQVFGVTGADQAFVYGSKYVLVVAMLLLLWLVWLRRLLKENSERSASHIPAQLLLLTSAGVVLIPSRIDFPQYSHALVYVADRMSLAAGVLFCAVLAQVRVRRAEMFALAAAAVVFFTFLYGDSASANRTEDQVEKLVQYKIPPGVRAVFLSADKNLRLDPLAHVMDRACVDHCFSYANYEPSTRQFRIRATPDNGIVVTSYEDAYQIGAGHYLVRPQDLPLYQVEACKAGAQQYCVRQLRAGEVNGHQPTER